MACRVARVSLSKPEASSVVLPCHKVHVNDDCRMAFPQASASVVLISETQWRIKPVKEKASLKPQSEQWICMPRASGQTCGSRASAKEDRRVPPMTGPRNYPTANPVSKWLSPKVPWSVAEPRHNYHETSTRLTSAPCSPTRLAMGPIYHTWAIQSIAPTHPTKNAIKAAIP